MGERLQLSPESFVELLRSGDDVDVDSYDLSLLAGRLCRGKEPCHFANLGGKGQTCFIVGEDGLKLFLEASGSGKPGAPLEMLLKIGYDILDIYEKLVEGWVFDLCVFFLDDQVVKPRKADWEGVRGVLAADFPVAAHAMKLHMERLKADGSAIENFEGYNRLQAEYGQENGMSDYLFSSKKLPCLSYAELMDRKDISVAAIRKFLFDNVGLNDLYGGRGLTRQADGSDGISEYLGRAVKRRDVKALQSTALGAPTVGACLMRMSDMCQALREQKRGEGKRWLDGWLPQQRAAEFFACQAAQEQGKERVLLTPRECASRLLMQRPLDAARQVLDGVGFRVVVGRKASEFCTIGGPREWDRGVVAIGPPSQLQGLMQILSHSEQPCLQVLLAVSWVLTDIFCSVQDGNSFQLVLVLLRPWNTEFPSALDDKEHFLSTTEGVIAFCRAHGYEEVAEALAQHEAEVCQPLTQTEWDEWSGWDRGRGIDYERFRSSAKGAAEVRQFVFQTLMLRAGWRGTGVCSMYFERRGDEGVPTYLARNRDCTEMLSEEFAIVALGTPRMEDLVGRLKEGLQELRSEAWSR